jgi:hypothetical protein
MKYDPYVKRYITLEDYIKECYGGLPNESMLEEYNKLPDHPGNTMNPKNINRLSSHTYDLQVFRITETGAEVAETVIVQFCKGDKSNPEEGQVGFFTESLIELCRIHLESVNQGYLKNPFTTQAIEHLQAALWNLEERQKNRQARGVFQTYQK